MKKFIFVLLALTSFNTFADSQYARWGMSESEFYDTGTRYIRADTSVSTNDRAIFSEYINSGVIAGKESRHIRGAGVYYIYGIEFYPIYVFIDDQLRMVRYHPYYQSNPNCYYSLASYMNVKYDSGQPLYDPTAKRQVPREYMLKWLHERQTIILNKMGDNICYFDIVENKKGKGDLRIDLAP